MWIQLEKTNSDKYRELNEYVVKIKNQISCSAAATFIIHHDTIVSENYFGSYESNSMLQPVIPSTRFNVASVRKSYIGFAISLALYQNKLSSIDDYISDYLDDLNLDAVKGVRIRHLLTHTHGLKNDHEKLFQPGTGWTYNNVGTNMLIRLIRKIYNAPLSEVMKQYVFKPCNFIDTGWCKNKEENLLWLNEEYAGEQGGETNLFVSARELALWGYFHLNRGFINGRQLVPKEVLEQAVINQSPINLDDTLPRNGFYWWIQDKPRSRCIQE
ncbi:serine hydrolase domain-containing protein [Paenibacillus radicis (ex Gao et al. 2016)]|uniref:Penicillin-binding protein n=1 Tax=Paenibacillus radicis (ex Gao et al. 2016) TaxID=1737354 RepID=A0A917M0D2_9BACL|nr:serine hydrolase domain-containing protein [Paenibacillus radicis (ex Gao et al. 2016)]GGG69683.1 penicillin-binding protein [Paenibacillus radicis (ex Gao et al. 2016)]